MVPDYDLGITILTAGSSSSLDFIREALTVPLLRAAEEIAQLDLLAHYTGNFNAEGLNSSLILAQDEHKSLYIEFFISNSTGILSTWRQVFEPLIHDSSVRIQIVPTLLYRDEKCHKGELWRETIVSEKRNLRRSGNDHCIADLDQLYYAGTPLFEIVFWGGEDGGNVIEELEMSGFRVKMGRMRIEESDGNSGAGNKSSK